MSTTPYQHSTDRGQESQVSWLTYPLLEGILPHATFLRKGGVSEGGYRSLNLSTEVGDQPRAVSENREIAFSAFGSHLKSLPRHEMEQVHGNNVIVVTAHTPAMVPSCDALITNLSKRALIVKHADCQAAIIYDPVQHAIAAVHSGWRGSVHNIYATTIAKMRATFGSHPSDLHVTISPSLGPKAAEFRNYQEELPPHFSKYHDGNHHFDFWAISHDQLVAAGVLSEHIDNPRLCTLSDSERFFSYRRDRITGRHMTFAILP